MSSFLGAVFLFAVAAFPSPVPETKLQGFEALNAVAAERDSLTQSQDNWSVTRNELGECKPVTVIYARGTIELGNVGSITGPPFFNALSDAMGANNLAIQGVDYPANILGYLQGGDSGGAAKTASLLEQAASQCPSTQIILSGYSQGAQVVHLGAAKVSPEVAARIAAVVVFGDPFEGRPFPNIDSSKVETFCFALDLICKDTIVVDTYHLSYSVDAAPAASFVKQHVNL